MNSFEKRYVQAARSLGAARAAWAKDRKEEDRKQVVILSDEITRIWREEMKKEPPHGESESQ